MSGAATQAVGSVTGPGRSGPLGYVPALNGLRALAVLLVVVHHSVFLLPHGPSRWVRDAGGWLGVDVFFALSGFLITTLLLDERGGTGHVSFRRFYARRALRLLPALYVLLVAYALYSVLAGLDATKTRDTIGLALVYATNFQILYLPDTVAFGLGHLWSLAIEEQFYLLWPALLILSLRRIRRREVLAGLLVAAIVAVVVHRAVLAAGGTDEWDILVRPDTRADTLLVGALGAVIWRGWRVPSRVVAALGWVGLVTLAACVLYGTFASRFWPYGGFTVVAVAATLMVFAAVDGTWAPNRVLDWRPVVVIGEVSYGIYLWHLAVFDAVNREVAPSAGWSVRLTLAVVLTALAVAASWFLVERPAGRLKRRFSRPVAHADRAPAAHAADPVAMEAGAG